MKKALRYGLIAAAVIVVALVAAPFFIDVNDYKDAIARKVEDATGRALTIGKIQVSLFPWVGMELADVHLANPQGFDQKDFASVEHLDIKLAVLPLLDGRYEIKEFKLVGPMLYLARNAAGQGNWEDLMGASEMPRRAGASGKEGRDRKVSGGGNPPVALAGLAADHILIQDGHLSWHDLAQGGDIEIDDLNVELQNVRLDRPVHFFVSGTLQGDAFELQGELGPVGNHASIDPSHIPLQADVRLAGLHLAPFSSWISSWPEFLGTIDQAMLKLDAKVEQRPDGQRMMELNAGLDGAHTILAQGQLHASNPDALDVRHLNIGMDGEKLLRISGQVRGLRKHPVFEFKLVTGEVRREWLARLVPQLTGIYRGHPSPWTTVRVSSLVAGDASRVEIRDLQLALDRDVLQGSGHLGFGRKPDVRLQLTAGALHLDPWLPASSEQPSQPETSGGTDQAPAIAEEMLAATGLFVPDVHAAAVKPQQGEGQEAKPVEPDLRFLKNWKLAMRVEIGTLYLRGLQLDRFRANVDGANGKIALAPMRFNLAGGKVEEQATLFVDRYPAHWRESVHVMGVHVGPVLQVLAGTDRLDGTLTMETSLRAVGLTSAAVKRLNGKGDIMLRDGRIKGLDIAGAIRAVTQPGAAQEGPKQTDFTQLSGSFRIRNGILTNKDLFMASPLLRVTGEGSVNLVERTLDYHLRPTVVGTLKGQGDTVTIRKGLTIPLRLTGSLDAIKVRPEVNAKSLIEGLGASGILGKALGKKRNPPRQGKKPRKAKPKVPVPQELLKQLPF